MKTLCNFDCHCIDWLWSRSFWPR